MVMRINQLVTNMYLDRKDGGGGVLRAIIEGPQEEAIMVVEDIVVVNEGEVEKGQKL